MAEPIEIRSAEIRLLETSPLFEAAWYAARYPEVHESGLAPALHYLRIGASKGYAPSPGFDGADYLRRYPDIARTGANPLVHFLLHGQKEGRKIGAADPEEIQLRLIAASGLFDAAWYLAACPEARTSGLDPVRHYIRNGRAGGHSPSQRFDAAAYIADYRDVAESSVNPLLHYLQFGRIEGRVIKEAPQPQPMSQPVEEKPIPSPPVGDAPAEKSSSEAANARLIGESGLFDARYYAASTPDVAASGLAPEIHYLRIGGRAGLAPSPRFDGWDYLARYRDIREAGLNPLLHYLAFGRAEKRKFRDWDPIESLVTPVTESGLYDEDWYVRTYPEVLQSKLSPLKHFIKHGREKGHNPSASFDCAAYIADNPELRGTAINPLVHYLQLGKLRDRPIFPVAPPREKEAARPVAAKAPPPMRPEPSEPEAVPAPAKAEASAADLALIEASALFDKDWYLRKYPDAARSGLTAAEHYLRIGAMEMRQPSSLFDPQYYVVEQAPGDAAAKASPLLHFLKEGQKKGLKPRALFQSSAPGGTFVPLSPAAWPLAATGETPAAPPSFVRHEELAKAPGEGSLLAGQVLIAHAPAPNVLGAAKARLAAFRAMGGLPRQVNFAVIRDKARDVLPDSGFEPRSYKGLGPAFASGPGRLADAWFADTGTLRLRLGEDGAAPGEPLVLRAFQAKADGAGTLHLAGEVALAAAPSFADLALVNPYMPLLMVLSKADGQAVEIGMLPFPSLCRGGHHYAELVGAAELSNPLDRLLLVSDALVRAVLAADGGRPLVSRIEVSLSLATGAEPVFAPDFTSWLARVFGIGVEAAAAAAPQSDGEDYLRRMLAERGAGMQQERKGGYTLLLPPDMIPALAALAASVPAGQIASPVAGSFFLTDGPSARPRLSVQLPRAMPDLLSLQPAAAPLAFPVLLPQHASHGSPVSVPQQGDFDVPHLAVRFAAARDTHRAALLMPLAPDLDHPVIGEAAAGPAIDVVVRTTRPERLEALLNSLGMQHDVSIGMVRAEHAGNAGMVPALQSVLDRLAPGRSDILTFPESRPAGAETVIAGSGNGHTLVLDDTVVLHDPRTLASLFALLRHGKTASAGCVLLRDAMARRNSAIQFESGGYFPSHVSLLQAPRLILSQPDMRGALPAASYPVIANDPAFTLYDNAALAAAGSSEFAGRGDAADFAFALQALAAGYRHLCTSAVRATVLGPAPPREAADPPGIGAWPAAAWQAIFERVTVLRELH